MLHWISLLIGVFVQGGRSHQHRLAPDPRWHGTLLCLYAPSHCSPVGFATVSPRAHSKVVNKQDSCWATGQRASSKQVGMSQTWKLLALWSCLLKPPRFQRGSVICLQRRPL